MLVTTKHSREAWLEGRSDSSNSEGEQKSWSKLWKLDVPSKVKIFLWRLAQQSIPTADVLHHRNMSTVDSCGLCGATDSWQHSLLHCHVACSVWALKRRRSFKFYRKRPNQMQNGGSSPSWTRFRRRSLLKYWLLSGPFGSLSAKPYTSTFFRVRCQPTNPS